jgi:hypothetical protein
MEAKMLLWCDINRTITNKNVTNWFEYNNSFNTVRITVEDLINEITNGYSYTTVHRKDTSNTRTARHADNFSFAQHFALDFDYNIGDVFKPTIKNVSSLPFVNRFASFVHQTASHTEESPRARAVFVLDYVERDRDVYSSALQFVNQSVGLTDTSCTDPVRVFFGATGCSVIRLGNTVSRDVFRGWAELGDRNNRSINTPIEAQTYEINDSAQFKRYVESAILSEVSSLANEASGSRHTHLLKSSTRLASIMKSQWSPAGMITTDSIKGMLMAACHDNGLMGEDGQASILKTIEDGIANSTPRAVPQTSDIKNMVEAHGLLPVSLDITTISEIDRIYSAFRAGRISGSLWDDVSQDTINKLGIVFTEDSVIIPFMDRGKLADIASKHGDETYDYQVGVDTVSAPEQPNSTGRIAVVTKNPEDVTVLFDRIAKQDTPYKIFGTSEIGKVVANRLSTDYDEVIFLTYEEDKNIEIAKRVIKNSGVVNLQGTIREMYGWGLNTQTLSKMLSQAW